MVTSFSEGESRIKTWYILIPVSLLLIANSEKLITPKLFGALGDRGIWF